MSQQKVSEDSFERMMEQGAAQDLQNNPLAQTKPVGGVSSINPFKAAASLAVPDTWVNELYGVSKPLSETSGDRKEQNGDNHTPLDMKKVGSKEQLTPQQRQFFKKYQEEYEQFLQEKKKKAENQKHQEEEEEKKKKEEERRKREQEEQNQDVHGKPKAKLGQPRRKATTEQHPETKAGGAK